MSGAIFETYAITEILKSWWFHGEQPQIHYYRDKDGKEIDLVIDRDNTLYPVETKSNATIKRSWINQSWFIPLSLIKIIIKNEV